MYEVTVEDTFSAGHYLRNYRGKCEKPHGHNYRVRVTLSGEHLDQAGLLLDFKDLKDVLRPVMNYLDHQMMNELEPFTTINPSAENLAKYFYDETNSRLKQKHERPGAGEGRNHLGDRHHHGALQRVGVFHADHRNLQVAAGRVLLYGSAVRVRAAGGMQPALHLVRQRVHLHWRPTHDAGRGRGQGASSLARWWTGRDHRRRAAFAGARSGSADGTSAGYRLRRFCWRPAASGRWSAFRSRW